MKAALITLGMGVLFVVSVAVLNGCGNKDVSDGTGSEVATSVVSGAVSNSDNGAQVGRYIPRISKPDPLSRLLDALAPEKTAAAFSLSCSGGSQSCVSTSESVITPFSCSVTYLGGRTSSTVWTGGTAASGGVGTTGGIDFLFSGSGCSICDGSHHLMELGANCVATHQNPATSPIVRTITGPKGNSYAITHDTSTPGGYDTGTTTSTGGVIITCDSTGCAHGRSVVISGSHITGKIDGAQFWDHTVSTVASAPVTVTGAGASRVIESGSVVVQHNLAKFTSTTVFNGPLTHTAHCCFPVSGSATTTFKGGKLDGKTETLTFSSQCGEATLTKSDGSTESYTLTQCI